MERKGEYSVGMDFGVGVDFLSGEVKGCAVIPGPITSIEGADAQQSESMIQQVETLEDFQHTLGISVRAKGNYGPFKGSAKVDYAERCNFSSYATFVCATVAVTNAFRQIKEARLRPEAADLIRLGKFDRFREQFGHGFVRGILSGGEYCGVISIISDSAEEQKTFAATVKAGFGIGIGGASAKVHTEISDTHTSSHLQVDASNFQAGGIGHDTDVTTADILDKAARFADGVRQKSTPFACLLVDYNTLDMPNAPNAIDLQVQQERLRDLAVLKQELQQVRNDIRFVLKNENRFEWASQGQRTALESALKAINDKINRIDRQASRCCSDPMQCQMPNDVDLPAVDLPERRAPAAGGARPPRIRIAPRPGRLLVNPALLRPDVIQRLVAKVAPP